MKKNLLKSCLTIGPLFAIAISGAITLVLIGSQPRAEALTMLGPLCGMHGKNGDLVLKCEDGCGEHKVTYIVCKAKPFVRKLQSWQHACVETKNPIPGSPGFFDCSCDKNVAGPSDKVPPGCTVVAYPKVASLDSVSDVLTT